MSKRRWNAELPVDLGQWHREHHTGHQPSRRGHHQAGPATGRQRGIPRQHNRKQPIDRDHTAVQRGDVSGGQDGVADDPAQHGVGVGPVGPDEDVGDELRFLDEASDEIGRRERGNEDLNAGFEPARPANGHQREEITEGGSVGEEVGDGGPDVEVDAGFGRGLKCEAVGWGWAVLAVIVCYIYRRKHFDKNGQWSKRMVNGQWV